MSLVFLEDDASPEKRIEAVRELMRQLMVRRTRAKGGQIKPSEDALWVYATMDGGEVALNPMEADRAEAHLNALMRYYRQRTPELAVVCWFLEPPEPADLPGRLEARGFRWNWRPHWMHLALADFPIPAPTPGLRLGMADTSFEERPEIPYNSDLETTIRDRMVLQLPRRIWHMGAWLDDVPVGHCMLVLTSGPLGVAGIFDVGVVETARQRGIGASITMAACSFAREMGCRHAVLNANDNGESLYRRLGFQTLVYGQSWLRTPGTGLVSGQV